MCVITAYGVRCLGCWLLEVRCRSAGYAFGLRDVARLDSTLRISDSFEASQKELERNASVCEEGESSSPIIPTVHETCVHGLKTAP